MIAPIIESVDDVEEDLGGEDTRSGVRGGVRRGVPCDCRLSSDSAGEGIEWSDSAGEGNDVEDTEPGGDTDGAEFGYGIESDSGERR